MLKYVNAKIVFREVPDEISLCIDITNCIYHCNNCHSPELRQDIDTPLTIEELNKLEISNTLFEYTYTPNETMSIIRGKFEFIKLLITVIF